MIDSMIVKTLGKLGFSEKEALVYLTLLELGPSLASAIAKRSEIKRSTVYVLLDSLVEKGIVHVSDNDDAKAYSASSPERLVQIAEESAKKFANLAESAKNILPDLKRMYIKPKVQIFEGEEGLISAYEDTLTSTETIRAYASIENMHAALPEYFPEYYRRRAKAGIDIRAIFTDTDAAKNRINNNKKEAREAYLVPKEKYWFSPEINFYDNKVVMMSLVEKFALIIESEELANALKKAFELSWKEAKRLHKKCMNKK